jgi:hypothetical protein
MQYSPVVPLSLLVDYFLEAARYTPPKTVLDGWKEYSDSKGCRLSVEPRSGALSISSGLRRAWRRRITEAADSCGTHSVRLDSLIWLLLLLSLQLADGLSLVGLESVI